MYGYTAEQSRIPLYEKEKLLERLEEAERALPPLTERLEIRRDRAERESSKASALSELLYLLEKNPDVARILNLMDQVER